MEGSGDTIEKLEEEGRWRRARKTKESQNRRYKLDVGGKGKGRDGRDGKEEE